MSTLPEKIRAAVDVIRSRSKTVPQVGIILGTGLGKLATSVKKEAEISYADIPHFAQSTVESHAGRLILGTLAGKPVVVMQGRFHYYEGYDLGEITFPVRVMKALGAKTLIVSNACGGVNHQFRAGDLMLITDHINLLGTNPLIGKNHKELGPRFPDMSEPYSRELIALAETVALELRIPVRKGVYASMSGPSLETAAEYRMLRVIGADAIGMSTVPEVIVAVHTGMKVLGISVITDECFPDSLKPVDIQKIIAVADQAEPKLVGIIEKVLEKM